jgi:holo-[acyl-carrier protein] synthase
MLGIGVDIVRIERIEKLWILYGDKFLKKIFFPEEIKESKEKGHFIQSISGKFSAKEAFIKATSSLVNQPISFLDILILSDSNNKPYITFTRNLVLRYPYQFLVSISHEKEYALSVVTVI